MDFRYTEAVVRRCSLKQVLLNTSQFWSFFLISFKNFIKKRLQHRCFSVKFAKEHLFYRALPVAASGNLMKSLFIAYDNDESCHCVGRMTLQRLIHFIARVSFLSISSFFLIFCRFYYLLRY